VREVNTKDEIAELMVAAERAQEVLAVIGAQYQRKIGPYATQAQAAEQRLGAAIKAAKKALKTDY